MADQTWQSVYFAYFLFALMAGGALFFFLRSVNAGYLGNHSEEPKERMLKDALKDDEVYSTGVHAPRRAE